MHSRCGQHVRAGARTAADVKHPASAELVSDRDVRSEIAAIRINGVEDRCKSRMFEDIARHANPTLREHRRLPVSSLHEKEGSHEGGRSKDRPVARRLRRACWKEAGMTSEQRASERITEEVTSWAGVSAGPGRRGEFAFKVGGREIGHLHGDHAAHFAFPKEVWHALFEEGRIDYHPVFPGRPGFGARTIETEADVVDVIALIRLNYERVIERHGLPAETAA
jgi:Luciferase